MNPFLVICIDHLNHHPHLPNDVVPEPEVGEIVEVIDSKKLYGILYYRFAGYGTHGYDSANYAPLNGPCELEIADARCREEAEALDIEFAEILENV